MRIFIVLNLLFCSLWADRLANLDYDLEDSSWSLRKSLDHEKLFCKIYSPQSSYFSHFFSVEVIKDKEYHFENPSLLHLFAKQDFPATELELNMIDRSAEFIVYEWKLWKNDGVKTYGLAKVFNLDNIILIKYQKDLNATDDLTVLKEEGLKMLNSACVIPLEGAL